MEKDEIQTLKKEFHNGLLVSLGNPLHDLYQFSVSDCTEQTSWQNYFHFINGLSSSDRQTDLGICTYVLGYCVSPHFETEYDDPSGNVHREMYKRLSCHYALICKRLNKPVTSKWRRETLYGEYLGNSILLEISSVGINEIFESFEDFDFRQDLSAMGTKLEHWIEAEIFGL